MAYIVGDYFNNGRFLVPTYEEMLLHEMYDEYMINCGCPKWMELLQRFYTLLPKKIVM